MIFAYKMLENIEEKTFKKAFQRYNNIAVNHMHEFGIPASIKLAQAILESGVEPKDLIALEQNGDFADLLKERFPNIIVAKANALELKNHIGALDAPPDFVISGLPLMLFTMKQKTRLISQAFEVLGPSGFFHQFTYGGKCPVERSILDLIGLKATFLKFALLNLPPAFVYRLERR